MSVALKDKIWDVNLKASADASSASSTVLSSPYEAPQVPPGVLTRPPAGYSVRAGCDALCPRKYKGRVTCAVQIALVRIVAE